MTPRRTFPAAVAIILLAMAGCGSPPQLRMNAAETFGKVYYLDGIGNYGYGREAIPLGFNMAGFRGDVEYWSWSATHTPLDQVGGGLVKLKGRSLAKLIALYCKTYPNRPVSLVGLSAGTGVAVWACEELPDGVYVDEVVLVASSLSQHYDLTKALRHVRGNITLYQTSGDFALGVGARILGTIDQSPLATAAGLTGFRPPQGLNADGLALYRRVVNVPYTPAFAALGFDGGHTSAVDSPSFVRTKIAPLCMRSRAPSEISSVPHPPSLPTGRHHRTGAPHPACGLALFPGIFTDTINGEGGIRTPEDP